MTERLVLATEQGAVICEEQAGFWRVVRRGLEDQRATSVIAREGVILLGTRDGIYRSTDSGASWQPASQGLTVRLVRWLAYHPQTSDFELAGTEPAMIFVSSNGGDTWQERPEVAQMRDRYGWSLPYSPRAGAVRGFAMLGERGYAAVEDGCVLVTDDGAGHWQLAQGSRGYPDHQPQAGWVHSDVHSIAVHPSSADLVYAPTGGGFYRSLDGGQIWQPTYRSCYCRACWVDPQDFEHILLGPADGVDYNGRIEETRDGGSSWHAANSGLDTPWPRTMVERFTPAGDRLLAVLSDGRLVASYKEQWEWQQILPEEGSIRAVAPL